MVRFCKISSRGRNNGFSSLRLNDFDLVVCFIFGIGLGFGCYLSSGVWGNLGQRVDIFHGIIGMSIEQIFRYQETLMYQQGFSCVLNIFLVDLPCCPIGGESNQAPCTELRFLLQHLGFEEVPFRTVNERCGAVPLCYDILFDSFMEFEEVYNKSKFIGSSRYLETFSDV